MLLLRSICALVLLVCAVTASPHPSRAVTATSTVQPVRLPLVMSDGPGFSLELTPATLRLNQGDSRPLTLTLVPQQGFTGVVSLTLANAPQGVSLSPATIAFSESLIASRPITLTVGNTTPLLDSAALTLTARAAAHTATASLTLTVLAAGSPSLEITPSRATLTAGRGSQVFSATLQNATEPISWTLSPDSGGSLDTTTGPQVIFTPPASATVTSTVTLTATAGALAERATITVRPANSATGDWLVKAFDTDGYTTCAIDLADALYCWGTNGSGEVGDGTTTPRERPVHVALPAKVRQALVSGYNVTALLNDGTVWSWGCNVSGKLGNGTRTKASLGSCSGVSTPQRVGTAAAPLNDVVEIATDNIATAARTATGDIYVWGGVDVQFRPAAPLVPTRVGTATGAVTIGKGSDDFCFARSDGSYDCVSPYGRQSAIYDRQFISERIPADARVRRIIGSADDVCVLYAPSSGQREVITCMGLVYSNYRLNPPRPSMTFEVHAPRFMRLVGMLNVVTSAGVEQSYGRNGLETLTPPQVAALRPLTAYVTASQGKAGCVIREGGELWCWTTSTPPVRATP
jgi:hypothetical protein